MLQRSWDLGFEAGEACPKAKTRTSFIFLCKYIITYQTVKTGSSGVNKHAGEHGSHRPARGSAEGIGFSRSTISRITLYLIICYRDHIGLVPYKECYK